MFDITGKKNLKRIRDRLHEINMERGNLPTRFDLEQTSDKFGVHEKRMALQKEGDALYQELRDGEDRQRRIEARLRQAKGWSIALFFLLGLPIGGYHAAGAIAHIETGSGQQAGVIVAVDHGGAIWKTTSVYIKTDQYASDTDKYCVTDPVVRDALKAAVIGGYKVQITYTQHVGWSKGCQWTSDETITAVTRLAEGAK